jgi:hypothetical protein
VQQVHGPGTWEAGGLAAPAPGAGATSGQGAACRRRLPGRVFDLTLPLEQAAEGCKAMDQRPAIKALLHP